MTDKLSAGIEAAKEYRAKRRRERSKSRLRIYGRLQDVLAAVAIVLLIGLVVGLLWGFIWALPGVSAGFNRDDGGFLQNLLSEGLGILVTVAIVTPATDYLGRLRLQREMENARESLIHRFFREIAKLAPAHEPDVMFIRQQAGFLPILGKDGKRRQDIVTNIVSKAEDMAEQATRLILILERSSTIVPAGGIEKMDGILRGLDEARRGYLALARYATGASGRLGETGTKRAVLNLPRLAENASALAKACDVTVPESLFKPATFLSPKDEERHITETIELINKTIYSAEIAREEEALEYFDKLSTDSSSGSVEGEP